MITSGWESRQVWGPIGYTQDVYRVGDSWQAGCTAVPWVLVRVGMCLVMHFLAGRSHDSSEELSQPLPPVSLGPRSLLLTLCLLKVSRSRSLKLLSLISPIVLLPLYTSAPSAKSTPLAPL